MYLGSWKIDDLLTFPANTHSASTGAATDADAVPTYRIYEDETGTAILAGNMALLDGSNTAGFYSEQVTLSAANGFEKGKCYTIYISAAVSSVTGTIAHTFQVQAETAAASVNTSALAQINAEVVDVMRTDTIPDSYSTDGSQPTFAQAVLAILQFLTEKSVSGTTVTVKKPDGSTSAMTFTMDSGTAPTSITRAT